MSDVRALLRQLEGCLQEEIGAQARACECLQAQEADLRSGDAQALDASSRALEVELSSAPARGARRALLIAKLAGAWRVDARSLTLGSIVQRSAGEGTRLKRLRDELRQVTAGMARQMRRNALAARLHQRAWSEILEGAIGAMAGDEALRGGHLVDAEG